jgi:hypothetical protein
MLQGLNLPPGYVVIELDDGDSRDFHIDSIRILPPDYPIVGKIFGYCLLITGTQ